MIMAYGSGTRYSMILEQNLNEQNACETNIKRWCINHLPLSYNGIFGIGIVITVQMMASDPPTSGMKLIFDDTATQFEINE